MTHYEHIEIATADTITTITINRPHARNALHGEAVAELKRAFRSFDGDSVARVGVIHGAGGAFCAGADLKQMSGDVNYEAWAGHSGGWLGAPLSKPLIAAVAGHAVAGGLGLALYCDIRIVDTTAVFGVFCRRFGVPMSDGTTVRLPRLIGESRAMMMMLTGRAVGAEEAQSIGLAAEVVPAGQSLQRAQALAAEIAQFPQRAMRSDRRSLLESRGLELDSALRLEARLAESAKRNEAQAGAALFAQGLGRHGADAND